MRYAQIREMDVSNGEGVGVSLFVQGCPIHCKNCFNKETWDFDGGNEWTKDIEDKFLNLVNRDYIQRVSILGGEPLANKNVETVQHILSLIPKDKQKWLYTGYQFETLSSKQLVAVSFADYLVDGNYVDELRDMRLQFRGSSNQRIIDIRKTMFPEVGEVVLKN